jgi:hypothetical protein
LIVCKEKQFVLLYRPADCATELILFVIIFGGGKVPGCVKCFITQKFKAASMKAIRACFCDDVDLPAGIVTVLCIEVVGHDAEFSD